MRSITLLIIGVLISMVGYAQIPTNDDKEYEYHAEVEIRRGGTGVLMKRLKHWSEEYFKAGSFKLSVDDSTNRYLEIQVTEDMVESHFGVDRSHTKRKLTYHVKFDIDRKSFFYWINDMKYKAHETGRKGVETDLDAKLSELKTAAKKSVYEEVDERMLAVIEAFTKAAETDLPD